MVVKLVDEAVPVHVQGVRQVREAVNQPEAVEDAEVRAGVGLRRREVHIQAVQDVDVPVVIDVDVEVVLRAGLVDVHRPVSGPIGEEDHEIRVRASEELGLAEL